jgi:hypothetical protein
MYREENRMKIGDLSARRCLPFWEGLSPCSGSRRASWSGDLQAWTGLKREGNREEKVDVVGGAWQPFDSELGQL